MEFLPDLRLLPTPAPVALRCAAPAEERARRSKPAAACAVAAAGARAPGPQRERARLGAGRALPAVSGAEVAQPRAQRAPLSAWTRLPGMRAAVAAAGAEPPRLHPEHRDHRVAHRTLALFAAHPGARSAARPSTLETSPALLGTSHYHHPLQYCNTSISQYKLLSWLP
jgi:hypothetical protein